MHSSKLATATLMVILALLMLSTSIAVPILFRPFYYIQIDAPRLPERTGWSEEAIREAYDGVLDLCVLGTPFGAGELSWSESGRSHFANVRVLFRADFLVLGATAVSAALLLLLRWLHRLEFYHPVGRGPRFWAGVLAAGLVLTVGVLAVLDFSRAFTVFHAIFLPGKNSWLFNPTANGIILIMLERFFLNYAPPIEAVLLFVCGALTAGDLLSVHRRTKETVLPR